MEFYFLLYSRIFGQACENFDSFPSTFEANHDDFRALCDFPEEAGYEIVPPVKPFNEDECVALRERCTEFNRLFLLFVKTLKLREEQNELNNPSNPIPTHIIQRIEGMTSKEVCVYFTNQFFIDGY